MGDIVEQELHALFGFALHETYRTKNDRQDETNLWDGSSSLQLTVCLGGCRSVFTPLSWTNLARHSKIHKCDREHSSLTVMNIKSRVYRGESQFGLTLASHSP